MIYAYFQIEQSTDRIFQHVNQLALDINWPINSFDLLTTLCDLSQLTKISLFFSGYHYFESHTLRDLLNLARNVRTLHMSYTDDLTLINEDICSVISRQIEQLEVQTMDLACMQLILTCVEQVSRITFISNRTSSDSWAGIIEWLTGRGMQFSQSNDHRFLQVWLNTTASE